MDDQEGTQSVVICCVCDSDVESKHTSRGDSNLTTAGTVEEGRREKGRRDNHILQEGVYGRGGGGGGERRKEGKEGGRGGGMKEGRGRGGRKGGREGKQKERKEGGEGEGRGRERGRGCVQVHLQSIGLDPVNWFTVWACSTSTAQNERDLHKVM